MVVNVFWIIKLLHVLEISHLVIIADFFFFFCFVIKVLVRAANVGAGLIAKGLKPENTTNVGIYSQNRVEVYHIVILYLSPVFVFSKWRNYRKQFRRLWPSFYRIKKQHWIFHSCKKIFSVDISGSFKTKRSEFMLFSAVT